MIATNQETE